MSRRDIIIVAVLINAGLLGVLFMMAIHPDGDQMSSQMEVDEALAVVAETPPPEEIEPIAFVQGNVGDEVDNALTEYVSSANVEKPIKEETVVAVETPPQPKSEPKKDYVEVVVKSGDYLEKIARANGSTISAIKDANHLTSEMLQIGQVLRIPILEKTKKVVPVASSDDDREYYVVQSGDNPWKIAKKFHVRFDKLLELNNLNEEKARNLKVGDKLRVR